MAIPEGASKDLIERAMRPNILFGRGLLGESSRGWGDFLVITMPEPWKAAEAMLGCRPKHIHFVESMEKEIVKRCEAEIPEADTIVGLGGGMSLDMAKYVASKRGVEPILVPSTASVDACVTNSIAIREDANVKYIGFVVPKVVICDFDLMQTAPVNVNRAGIGDILSIHTGTWDWRAGADKGIFDFDEHVAREANNLVGRLEDECDGIREASEEALRFLVEAYAAENALCIRVGHSRPEEGSEHYFAYNVEHRRKRAYIHGELVCLGILMMSRLQDNEIERVEKILEKTGVRFQPRDLELSKEDVESALLTLKDYVEKEKLPYSVINEKKLDEESTGKICKDLKFQ